MDIRSQEWSCSQVGGESLRQFTSRSSSTDKCFNVKDLLISLYPD